MITPGNLKICPFPVIRLSSEMPVSCGEVNSSSLKEIKRIPHPKKVQRGEEKLISNYRLEEVCGYGTGTIGFLLKTFL